MRRRMNGRPNERPHRDKEPAFDGLACHWNFLGLELELSSLLVSPSIPPSTTDPSLLLAFYLTITTGQPIMLTITLAAALSSVAVVQAETVLGAVSMPLHYLQFIANLLRQYMFHRHGDRTDKSHPPTVLTDVGYNQVYNSGQYYRTRYVESGASSKIAGLNTDIVLLSQIQASAPADNVIDSSATGFLQGLYPPVGATISAQTLANGSTISAPMNGYQIIPISLQTTGSNSEDAGWLQSATSCNNAEISSNQYYYTQGYNDLLNSTGNFYQSLLPVINGTFTSAQDGYKNAYTSMSGRHVSRSTSC